MPTTLEKLDHNYGFFYKKDDIFYIKDYSTHIAIGFIDDEWKRVIFSDVDEEHGYQKIDATEAKGILKEKLPEFDIFRKMVSEEMKEYYNFIMDLGETTPRKVIGWISDSYLSVLKETSDEDETHYAALFKYLRMNSILMAGDEYQNLNMEPLFDDMTYLHFSRRGWGAVMAMMNQEFDLYSYAGYTEKILFDEHEFISHYPPMGLNNEITINNEIILSDDDYHNLIEDRDNYILYLKLSKDIIYPGNEVVIYDSKGNFVYLDIAKEVVINSKEEVDEYLTELIENNETYIVVNKMPRTPLLLLILIR